MKLFLTGVVTLVLLLALLYGLFADDPKTAAPAATTEAPRSYQGLGK